MKRKRGNKSQKLDKDKTDEAKSGKLSRRKRKSSESEADLSEVTVEQVGDTKTQPASAKKTDVLKNNASNSRTTKHSKRLAGISASSVEVEEKGSKVIPSTVKTEKLFTNSSSSPSKEYKFANLSDILLDTGNNFVLKYYIQGSEGQSLSDFIEKEEEKINAMCAWYRKRLTKAINGLPRGTTITNVGKVKIIFHLWFTQEKKGALAIPHGKLGKSFDEKNFDLQYGPDKLPFNWNEGSTLYYYRNGKFYVVMFTFDEVANNILARIMEMVNKYVYYPLIIDIFPSSMTVENQPAHEIIIKNTTKMFEEWANNFMELVENNSFVPIPR